MIEMATITNDALLEQLGALISEACDRGDSVSAIAERAGVQRDLVSGLRNGTYRATPTLARTEAILRAIGFKVTFEKMS
jgi:DNA-binding phage protein